MRNSYGHLFYHAEELFLFSNCLNVKAYFTNKWTNTRHVYTYLTLGLESNYSKHISKCWHFLKNEWCRPVVCSRPPCARYTQFFVLILVNLVVLNPNPMSAKIETLSSAANYPFLIVVCAAGSNSRCNNRIWHQLFLIFSNYKLWYFGPVVCSLACHVLSGPG